MGTYVNKEGRECIGLTRAQVEAEAVRICTQTYSDTGDGEVPSVERLLEMDVIKRCSKHPDHFLSTTWRNKARKRALDKEARQ